MNFLDLLIKRVCGFGLLGLQCVGDDGNAEEEYNKSVQPARDYQADMQQLFKETYKPYVQDISSLWSQYGKPIQQGQLENYQNVSLPLLGTLGNKISSDVNTPWDESEMKSVFDKIWQQTREKTAAEFDPITQRTSQRLAGAGALDTGASIKAFGDIEQNKYKSLETQAIDQALQEFNVKNTAKQQSYTNAFQYLSNSNPSLNTSAITGVGNWQPEVIPSYIEQNQDLTAPLIGAGGSLGSAWILAQALKAAAAPATGGASLAIPV